MCVLICAYMKIMNIEHQASSDHEVGGCCGVDLGEGQEKGNVLNQGRKTQKKGGF